MKFRINNRELAKAILPSVVVATDNCIKDFVYEDLITITAKDKEIKILSYGGTAASTYIISDADFSSLNYLCEESGSTTVNAFDFNDSLLTMEQGDVEISMVKGEVRVILLSDMSSKRTIGVHDAVVVPPNIGTIFEQDIEVRKEVFERGLNDVSFAPADEEKMITYMCMLMEASVENGKQNIIFSAGTGGRFAIKSIGGKAIFTASEDISIIFPKNNLKTIHKVISNFREDKFKIRTVIQNSSKDIPEQIMIECGNFTLSLFGSENFTKYPNLKKIIDYQYPNRIYSDLKGWEYAIGGTTMTRRGHDSNIHNTEVIFESENERFMVTPQTAHACTTPVHIVNINDCVAKGDKIWFKCNTKYLEEVVARSKKHGTMQFNFESQAVLDEIPHGKPKQMRPVLIKFPEKSNDAQEITENFCMFFTVSTK